MVLRVRGWILFFVCSAIVRAGRYQEKHHGTLDYSYAQDQKSQRYLQSKIEIYRREKQQIYADADVSTIPYLVQQVFLQS